MLSNILISLTVKKYFEMENHCPYLGAVFHFCSSCPWSFLLDFFSSKVTKYRARSPWEPAIYLIKQKTPVPKAVPYCKSNCATQMNKVALMHRKQKISRLQLWRPKWANYDFVRRFLRKKLQSYPEICCYLCCNLHSNNLFYFWVITKKAIFQEITRLVFTFF